jgi:hypothetical protein
MNDSRIGVQQAHYIWQPNPGGVRFAPYAMLALGENEEEDVILINLVLLEEGKDNIPDWEEQTAHPFTGYEATRREDGTFELACTHTVTDGDAQIEASIHIRMNGDGRLVSFSIAGTGVHPGIDLDQQIRINGVSYEMNLCVTLESANAGLVWVFLSPIQDGESTTTTTAHCVGFLLLGNGTAKGSIILGSSEEVSLEFNCTFNGHNLVSGTVKVPLSEKQDV